MSTIAQRLAAQYPQTNRQWGAALVPLKEEIAGPLRPAIGILLGGGCPSLLVACANVANLMLARGALRRREMAIRTSLGAARSRLVRQLLAEGAVLSLAAGAFAVVIAQAVKVGIVALLPAVIRDRLPFVNDLAISPGLVLTALAISLATVALVSLVPALDGSKLDARRFARSHRLSSALVVAEAALAVVLVVGAGLALRSLVRVLDVHPGFAPENLLGAQVALPQHKYPKT
jgi:cell division protein FtsX